MKKLAAFFSLALMTLALTSCEVHWFNQTYDAPWYVVALILVLIVIPTILITGYRISRRTYRCPKCNMTFYPKWYYAMLSVHVGAHRVFRCPHCGNKGFCFPTKDE